MAPRGHKINTPRFRSEMRKHGIDNASQLGAALGMNRSTTGRALKGEILAGPAFTTAACRYFGVGHDDLFLNAAKPAKKAAKRAA